MSRRKTTTIERTTNDSCSTKLFRHPARLLATLSVYCSGWLARLGLGLFSIVVALAICVTTGLVPKWGHWYSINMAYRRQTEAMLHGSLALDYDPRALGYDMAWANGAVQQVWGLGVPIWRLPFELVAKLFGYAAFPDRLALLAAVALLIYALFRLLRPASAQANLISHAKNPERVAGALLLILFPPFLTLCRTNFDVYEEAQTYTYIAGITLFALTIWLIRGPTSGRYILLSVIAGLAAFVRPTLLCYGFASLLVALWVTRREDWKPSVSWVGPGLFCFVGGLLFLTNLQRFGSGFEFGHELNVNVFSPMMYATRIENPVPASPLSARVIELFSYLFLVRENMHCCDGYASHIFPGQASVVRWRDIYFSTYDLTFLVLIVPAWGASFLLWWGYRAKRSRLMSEASVMGIWSFLSALPLFVLFLNYPVMSSRYMMDFAPSFAVAIWAALQLSCQLLRRSFPARLGLVALPILVLCAWWTYQVFTAEVFSDTSGGTVARVKLKKVAHELSPLNNMSSYTAPMYTDYNIPFNGYGWRRADGRTASLIVFFFPGAQRVELELRPIEGARVDEKDWDQIRVKIGLEELKRNPSLQTTENRSLTFTRSSKPVDPSRIEIAFIAMTSAEKSLSGSKFYLERVRWRDDISK